MRNDEAARIADDDRSEYRTRVGHAWVWSTDVVMKELPGRAASVHALATLVARYVLADGTAWRKDRGGRPWAFVLDRKALDRLCAEYAIPRRNLERHRVAWRRARLSHGCHRSLETLFVAPFTAGLACPGCRRSLPSEATESVGTKRQKVSSRATESVASRSAETAISQRKRAGAEKGFNEGSTQERDQQPEDGRAAEAAALMRAKLALAPLEAIKRATEIPAEIDKARAAGDLERLAILDAERRAYVEGTPVSQVSLQEAL